MRGQTRTFSDAVKVQVRKLLQKLPHDVPGFERDLAKYVLEVLSGSVTKQHLCEIDKVITFLDVSLSDNYPSVQISHLASKLLVEAMHLHDIGKSYGADLSVLRDLANEILRNPTG